MSAESVTAVLDSVPPTEPQGVEVQPKRRGRPPGSKNKPAPDLTERPSIQSSATPDPMFAKTTSTISGADLVPSADRLVGVVQESYWYWVGLRDDALAHSITCSGIAFPSGNWEKGAGGNMELKAGALVKLTRDKIDLMRQRLPRIVVRKMAGKKEEAGAGQNVSKQPFEQGAWGQLITIPTAEDIVQARKENRMTRRYEPSPNDRPAAEVMYCVLCSDQKNPRRGMDIPPPLSVSGLAWPVPIEDEESAA